MESNNILTKYFVALSRIPRKWIGLCMDKCVKELNKANAKRISEAIEKKVFRGK